MIQLSEPGIAHATHELMWMLSAPGTETRGLPAPDSLVAKIVSQDRPCAVGQRTLKAFGLGVWVS